MVQVVRDYLVTSRWFSPHLAVRDAIRTPDQGRG